jgi:hypothetical protein
MNLFVFVWNLLKPIFTFLRRLGSQQDYGYRMITGLGFGAVFLKRIWENLVSHHRSSILD